MFDDCDDGWPDGFEDLLGDSLLLGTFDGVNVIEGVLEVVILGLEDLLGAPL